MNQRALASQHKIAQSQRIGRFGRSMTLVCAVLLSVLTIAALVFDQMYRPDKFIIDQLKIVGSFKRLDQAQIQNVVAKSSIGNFFSIDLRRIKSQLEELEWVQSVELRRHWPNMLEVRVKEQSPIMRWQGDQWVNSEGEIIKVNYDDASNYLIDLYGNKRDSKIMLFKALAWQKKLLAHGIRVRSLHLSASQSYSLKLQISGREEFELKLGSEQVDQRLERFLVLYDLQLRSTIERFHRVDARYPNGVAVNAKEYEVLSEEIVDNVLGTELEHVLATQLGDYQ